MARDLTELSLADLLEEARRRGIVGAETMQREALIDVLTEPDRRGPMSMARKLLGRVVRAVIPGPERRSERPPDRGPEQGWRPEADRPDAGRPGGLPTMARGHAPVPGQLPSAAADALLDPTFAGIRLLDAPGPDGRGLAIVWRIPEAVLEGAQAIAHATADLRLRTVRVRWTDVDGDVVIDRTDHGSVRTEGALALPARAPGERIVVALGLGGDDGSFVAALSVTL